jgi:hypothetical protein
MSQKYHLAQLNIARAKAPIDDPAMESFASRLDEINALAESAPGFVWRFESSYDDSQSAQIFDDELILPNLSVWESPAHLRSFVYRGDHTSVMRQRRFWFERIEGAYLVLWWIPAGHIPTLKEAKERLLHLRERGESPYAFSFARIFPSPDHEAAQPTADLSDPCPAV